MTFKERFLAEQCSIEDMHDDILKWHNGQHEDTEVSLQDFLGFTDAEYNLLMFDDCVIEALLRFKREKMKKRKKRKKRENT